MRLNDSTSMSLQDAFKKFRKKRMEQIQATKKMIGRPLDETVNSKRAEWLRAKFMSQALKYLGVPYAKKYHEEGSPDYDAPLYLDCCALVRRVLLDLKNELGFRIGRWNQAYQFDTLPITIEKEEDMKPGDLVFISGTYFAKGRKKQRHNMVHVEIWLGDGEKTVGARYHKGRVQIHDSYRFVSKSYHSMKYHFKSIDTWLNGVCRSFCSTHAWRSSKYLNHGKKSIFAKESDEDACSESAGDSDFDEVDDEIQNNDENHIQNQIVNESQLHEGIEKRADLNESFDDSDHIDAGYVEPFGNVANCLEDRGYVNFHDCGGSTVSGYENLLSSKVGAQDARLTQDPESPTSHHVIENNSQGSSGSVEESSIQEENSVSISDIYMNDCDGALSASEVKLSTQFPKTGSDTLGPAPESYLEDPSCNCIGACDCHCCECMIYHIDNSEVDTLDAMEGEQLPKTCPSDVNAKQQAQNQQIQSNDANGSKLGRGNLQTKSRSKSPSKQSEEKMSVAASSMPRSNRRTTPKFFIGGNNGVALVEKPLLEKGWRRIDDNKDLSYYLKWVECKSRIDYQSFRAGQQLVNHIPNGGCLTTKAGLLKSLQDYVRVYNRTLAGSTSKLDLHDFYPETYKVENRADLDTFKSIFKDGETWICKPSGLNQGKGIFLLRSPKELHDEIRERSGKRPGRGSTARIVSRYIDCPLLLNGSKFDIRAYMLIASTTPYLVLYHSGYVRISCSAYSKDSTDLAAHLTNQFVQKKHPEYSEKKDDTIWTMEKLNNYINLNYKDSKGLGTDWALIDMVDKIKEIMLICFRSVEHKLERKCGYFDLLGFDFMIDDDMKVWLLEINVNPALFTNCESLRKVVPGIVEETVKISVEAFENKCSRKKIYPMESLKTFEVLYDEERKIVFERAQRRDRIPEGILNRIHEGLDISGTTSERSKANDIVGNTVAR